MSELEQLGGEAGIRKWMTLFYGAVPDHPVLAPLFTADLAISLERQTAYMIEFFGGPAKYTESYGKPFLRFRHRHIRIGEPERDAWLALLLKTLEEVTSDEDLIESVRRKIEPIATAMINHHPEKKDAYYFN